MRWVLAASGLLLGCNQILGLEHTRPAPDAPPVDAIDAAFFDAPLDAACTTATINVQIDGSIIGASPTLPLTGDTLMNLSDGLQAHGLVRFDLSGFPSASYYSLTLVLPFATHSTSCSAGCGSCLALEHDGYLDVFAMRSDWKEPATNELGATWNCRYGSGSTCPTTGWGTAGAVGGADRGVKLATMHHLAGQDSQVVIKDLADLTPWISGTLLTLQVVPAPDQGVFIVRTHENVCDAGAHAAQLIATYCQ